MNTTEFQLQGVSDPRLAAHATSGLPAWLWSTDGTRVVWANPPGAQFFGAANAAELAKRTFGPADPHRRQAAQLAGRLPASGAVRLERLRGFGARPGMLVTCACMQIDFPAGNHAILIAPIETSLPVMPLLERLQRLVQGIDLPIAIFAPDGTLVATSEAARAHPGFGTLSEAGLDAARASALAEGRAEATSGIYQLVLQRIGAGADVALAALISPSAFGAAARTEDTAGPGAATPPDYELPGLSGEAPAEFALLDDVAPPRVETAAPTADAEPSPYVEAVADEPMTATKASALEQAAPPAPPPIALWRDFPIDDPRSHPLRFVWQMDVDARFTLTADEFLALAGAPTAARLGRSFAEIADALGLDPQARVMKAFATHDTWSGITLNWPVEDGGSLAVELAGLAVYDRTRRFVGFRGFGVCRDLEALARLAAFRNHQREHPAPAQALSSDIVASISDQTCAAPGVTAEAVAETEQSLASPALEVSSATDLDKPVETPPPLETPPNVVPFRPLGGEAKMPALTPVENSAFNELARQLSARLEHEQAAEAASQEAAQAAEPVAPEATESPHEPDTGTQPEWLMPQQPPARGEDKRDRTLLDLLPTGVLIYRLDSLLYANPAFLQRMGYPSLHALEQAGGLDALYVEPGVPSSSSTSQAGTPVTISPSPDAGEGAARTEAKLFTIRWDGDSALALMFVPGEGPAASAAPVQVKAPVEAGHADAEDLAAILDTTAEGIVMFDASGSIHACNRSAEALFGYDGGELAKHNLAELIAPESRQAVLDYLASVQQPGAALDVGRAVLGRVARGGIIPLSMTMGRTRAGGPNFFAVFRDQSQGRQSEGELREARRIAERATTAKADMLARISHEIRTPLNAIIGFAEVMIAERFGPLGNERYADYLKDIRAAGERVTAIIDDLTELSRIETGKLDLAFISQNLNELVENCVSVMQPQANRERIIIRTSLAHLLPPVVADARSLRQITMNLIGNSIQLANPGGQVIVSTALSDHGEVILRVRDTGHGLNDNEVAAALEPFRTPPPSDKSTDKAELNLSLAKALVEANRAQFHIKTGGRSGTLVEVVFARALARA